jgi:AraC-like DNA-binding protein
LIILALYYNYILVLINRNSNYEIIFVKSDTKKAVWNNIHQLDGKLYCGRTRSRKREIRATEQQQDWAISYIVSGGGAMEISGCKYELKSGMICQRIPGMKYRLEFYGDIEQERYFIGLPRAGYEMIKTAEPDLSEEPIIDIGVNHDIVSRLKLFIEKYGAVNDFSWRMTGELFDLAAIMLNPQKLEQNKLDPHIAVAVKMLDNPENLVLDLPELARAAGLGYNNFRKIFVRELGMSPGDYRIERRIDFARQMLSSGMSQQETADALAYSDVYAFARQFKQRARVTPGEFIRNL